MNRNFDSRNMYTRDFLYIMHINSVLCFSVSLSSFSLFLSLVFQLMTVVHASAYIIYWEWIPVKRNSIKLFILIQKRTHIHILFLSFSFLIVKKTDFFYQIIIFLFFRVALLRRHLLLARTERIEICRILKMYFASSEREIDFRLTRFTLFSARPEKLIGLRYNY